MFFLWCYMKGLVCVLQRIMEACEIVHKNT